jgi:hypothetical protein
MLSIRYDAAVVVVPIAVTVDHHDEHHHGQQPQRHQNAGEELIERRARARGQVDQQDRVGCDRWEGVARV